MNCEWVSMFKKKKKIPILSNDYLFWVLSPPSGQISELERFMSVYVCLLKRSFPLCVYILWRHILKHQPDKLDNKLVNLKKKKNLKQQTDRGCLAFCWQPANWDKMSETEREI